MLPYFHTSYAFKQGEERRDGAVLDEVVPAENGRRVGFSCKWLQSEDIRALSVPLRDLARKGSDRRDGWRGVGPQQRLIKVCVLVRPLVTLHAHRLITQKRPESGAVDQVWSMRMALY